MSVAPAELKPRFVTEELPADVDTQTASVTGHIRTVVWLDGPLGRDRQTTDGPPVKLENEPVDDQSELAQERVTLRMLTFRLLCDCSDLFLTWRRLALSPLNGVLPPLWTKTSHLSL